MIGKIAGVRYGRVVDNVDSTGAGRISVRLYPEDNNKTDDNLEVTAFPLIPKIIHIRPKIGEGVFVLLATSNDGNSQRYYVGPVVSQIHRMYYEPWFKGGDTYQRGAGKDFDVNPYLDDDAYGAYPGGDDIAIIGRKNADIQITEEDVRIRAGVKLVSDETKYKIVFNRKNPAYIKVKYHEKPLDGDNASTVTLVADKVNLLSNKSPMVSIEENDTGENDFRDDLITDNKLNEILNEAYRLPYGEILVDLLKKMIDVFCKHTHDYAALPPNALFIEEIQNAAQEPLYQEKMLSDTVRIN
jgi:hypothetical protein